MLAAAELQETRALGGGEGEEGGGDASLDVDQLARALQPPASQQQGRGQGHFLELQDVGPCLSAFLFVCLHTCLPVQITHLPYLSSLCVCACFSLSVCRDAS